MEERDLIKEFIDTIDENWEKELDKVKKLVKDMDKNYRVIYYELKKKNVGIAAFLSLLAPGVGHLYIGKGIRGLVIFSICFIALLFCIILIGFLIIPLIMLFSIYDACKLAKSYNDKLFKVLFEEGEEKES